MSGALIDKPAAFTSTGACTAAGEHAAQHDAALLHQACVLRLPTARRLMQTARGTPYGLAPGRPAGRARRGRPPSSALAQALDGRCGLALHCARQRGALMTPSPRPHRLMRRISLAATPCSAALSQQIFGIERLEVATRGFLW